MLFYKNTGCKLFLVGQLHEISIKEDQYILLERKRLSGTDIYKIYIDTVDYTRLSIFGYNGMFLSVSGDLLGSTENTQIVATKVAFISMPQAKKWQKIDYLEEIEAFDACHIEKLKNSTAYQSRLYQQAIENVH